MSIPKFTLLWKTKLLLGFAVILLVFAAAAVFNLMQIRGMSEQLARQNEKTDMKRMSLELKVLVQELKDISSGLMISRDMKYVDLFEAKREEFKGLIRRVGDTAVTEEQRVWRSRLIVEETEFLELFDRAVGIMRSGGLTELDIRKNTDSLYKEAQAKRDVIFELVDKFYVDYTADADAAVRATNERMAGAVNILLAAGALVLLITVLISAVLLRSFLRPIRRMQRTMGLIGEGDLRHRIGSPSGDELGQLSSSFDRMMDNVSAMLGRLRDIGTELNGRSAGFTAFARSTASANEDIVKAMAEIASGTDRQTDITERSAALVRELGEQTADIARSADEMKRLSDHADAEAKRGEETVSELSEAAERAGSLLSEAETSVESFVQQSAKISRIVDTLSDISGQTNILALNASIEAARAGQTGKGFIVIADEVRLLSDQSKAASQSIGELVGLLKTRMEDMRMMMRTAGEASRTQRAHVMQTMDAFRAIERSVAELNGQADRIHTKVKRSEAGNAELIDAMLHVASIAEETAAGVQEVNSTSIAQHDAVRQTAEQADAVHALAESLFAEIGKFRTSDR